MGADGATGNGTDVDAGRPVGTGYNRRKVGHCGRRPFGGMTRARGMEGVLDFPGYSVMGVIGRGGMATVYRARQDMLHREVALKVLIPALAADPANAQRFLQEARMLASLSHPHVVPVYDVGVTPSGKHYFSMQLLENGDFFQRLQRGVGEAELVRVLSAVADALAYAHARGYVHRDVTPANILFDSDDKPYLTDFGIARAMALTSRITASGLSVGTSHYMSPEQARGSEVDPRSDIYSLGVLCYEALTGKPPFEGEDGFAVAYSHVHDPVPPLPEPLAKWQPLIDRCMAKDPAERFQECGQFIEALRGIAFAPRAPVAKPPRPITSTEIPAVDHVVSFPDPDDAADPAKMAPALSPGAVASQALVPSDEEQDASDAQPAWLGPAAGVLGLLLVLGLFAWKPWERQAAAPLAADAAAGAVPAGAMDSGVENVTLNAVEAERVSASDDDVGLDVSAMHGVQDPVETLLQQARQDLAARRYTSPPGRNALERYLLVQRFEPGNTDARAGIERVAGAYLLLADEHAGDDDPSMWLGYLQRAEELGKQHEVPGVEAGAVERRKTRVAELVEQAEAAVQGWERERAVLLYERALSMEPGEAALESALARARNIGRSGFAFHDGSGARRGPEMVVVGKLAFSRTPVTRAQFQRYWAAAGEQRFGASLPSCRDRESLFRSRSHTFLSPGFSQADNHPVVCVSAAMADDYARWLSQGSGKVYRVPASAELLAAGVGFADDCTANVRDAAYRAQFGGRDALACNDGHAATSPVSAFRAGRGGLRDLGGNVREWSADCVGGACRERIVVGASWHSSRGDGGAQSFPADTGFNTIGFRVVRQIE